MSTWIETMLEKGDDRFSAAGLSEFIGGSKTKDDRIKTLQFAQRLVQVAGAVDDVLDAEVLKADVLSELVNLGGAYTALNPMPYGNVNFFLDTALNSNSNKASNDLEVFLKHYSKLQVKEILTVSNSVLKVISEISSSYAKSKMRDVQILENWMDDILNYANVKKSLGAGEYIFDPTGLYEDITQARSLNSHSTVARHLYTYSVSSPVLIASTGSPLLIAQDSVWDNLGGGLWGLFSGVIGGGIYLITNSLGKIIRFEVSEGKNLEEIQEDEAVGKLLVGAIPTDKNMRPLKPGDKFKENERVDNYDKPGGDRTDQINEIEQVANDANQDVEIISTPKGSVFVVKSPKSKRTISGYPESTSKLGPTTSIEVNGVTKVIKIRYTKGIIRVNLLIPTLQLT